MSQRLFLAFCETKPKGIPLNPPFREADFSQGIIEKQ
jgi:hypothetical protein